MNLPNAEKAIIPLEKVRYYLLSPIHPIGRYKAAFFRSHGYEQTDWEILTNDIRSILSEDATLTEATEFGVKYTITGNIAGPNDRIFGIVAICIILRGEEIPRLVTAYPED